MLNTFTRGRVIALWAVAIAIALGASLVVGAAATPSTWTLLFFISLAPPALVMMIWRGAPPPTAAEVLYAARQPDGR